jgi:hypothetical protein
MNLNESESESKSESESESIRQTINNKNTIYIIFDVLYCTVLYCSSIYNELLNNNRNKQLRDVI